MLKQICAYIIFGGAATCMTYETIAWWFRFGTHEVYPYLGTLMSILLWVCLVLNVTEED